MKLTHADIPGVVIIDPTVFEDSRGWFMESFNEETFHRELTNIGLPTPSAFVQDNHSCSKKGVLRGLHYQLSPLAQGKLVRVTRGAAYDVAVDIREDSPTFGKSVGIELSEKNNRMLWIPEGFAHGFLALEDDTHFICKTTAVYSKEHEASIRWDSPDLVIDWPMKQIDLNEKDQAAPFFKKIKKNPNNNKLIENKLIDLRVIGDERGSLIALENKMNIPFKIQRVYYIFATKLGVSRGFHAHKNLEQLLVCVSGKCRIVLDDGKIKKNIWLDAPNQGLLIDKMIWREMHDFSENCVLMVLSSHIYDESDYIRDYQDFIGLLNK